MKFKLLFSPEAKNDLDSLSSNPGQQVIYKAVLKTLARMEVDLRHPSLNTHEFKGLKGPAGQKVFEAYAQQNTPGAYRIIWCYGPSKNLITIITIIPHPD